MPKPLPNPAVPVALDVALWFLERARSADSHLPAQKLQDLLYLAAAHYEAANRGQPLAPLVFVANDIAVVDPNVYRLLEDGRPRLRAEAVPERVQGFLQEIWNRYGHGTVEHLNGLVARMIENEGRAEVGMSSADGSPLLGRRHPEADRNNEDPSPRHGSVRPTHRGRQVTVAPWRPPSAPKKPNK